MAMSYHLVPDPLIRWFKPFEPSYQRHRQTKEESNSDSLSSAIKHGTSVVLPLSQTWGMAFFVFYDFLEQRLFPYNAFRSCSSLFRFTKKASKIRWGHQQCRSLSVCILKSWRTCKTLEIQSSSEDSDSMSPMSPPWRTQKSRLGKQQTSPAVKHFLAESPSINSIQWHFVMGI